MSRYNNPKDQKTEGQLKLGIPCVILVSLPHERFLGWTWGVSFRSRGPLPGKRGVSKDRDTMSWVREESGQTYHCKVMVNQKDEERGNVYLTNDLRGV